MDGGSIIRLNLFIILNHNEKIVISFLKFSSKRLCAQKRSIVKIKAFPFLLFCWIYKLDKVWGDLQKLSMNIISFIRSSSCSFCGFI